jgi:uncharacterized protein YueI
MSNQQLKVKKEVKGSALIELGINGSLAFEQVTVYMNDHSEKDMVLMIVDKNNPDQKIQLTFNKPAEFVEVKKPDDPIEEKTENTSEAQDPQ